jgi:hypothetical protein
MKFSKIQNDFMPIIYGNIENTKPQVISSMGIMNVPTEKINLPFTANFY